MSYRRSVLGVCVALAGSVSSARGEAPPGRYAVSEGTVRDELTGLIWQQTVSPSSYSWTAAQEYCRTLVLGGFSSGCRLPTRKELETIGDPRVDPQVAAVIDATAFPTTPRALFWSSTPYEGTHSQAWYVSFADGTSYGNSDSVSFRVRCVR